MAYIVSPVLGMNLADPATVQAFETTVVNNNFLAIEGGFTADRVRLTALEAADTTFNTYDTLRSGTGGVANWKVTDIAELDALATAEIGDTAYMTTPGTGIGALTWTAYAGSGSGLDWRLADQVVIASTKANLDSFISAVAATSDLSFRDGTIAYVTATRFMYKLTSDAGALDLQPSRIIPSAATNGSVDANGVVTSTAQSLVRARDAFPTEFQIFRVLYDITMSAASGLNVTLAVGASDAATAYDNQRHTDISTTSAAVQALNTVEFHPSPIGVSGARHVGEFVLVAPNLAAPTYLYGLSAVAAPAAMTTSTGRASIGALHRTTTAYDSIKFYGSSGNVTINRLTFEGIS